ncbi:MAG TPA: L,D-transpeptidase family protein [Chitinophagaceae bacterium]|nr:L,D-transpeptidase family protein [Chitinophagaceae bacterium]
MKSHKFFCRNIMVVCLLLVLFSCSNKAGKPDTYAETPEELQDKTTSSIERLIESSLTDTTGAIDSVVKIYQPAAIKEFYSKYDYAPLWSTKGQWQPAGDSLAAFIRSSRLYGLFPDDYHDTSIHNIRQQFAADSINKGVRKDAALWAKADIMLTDAFLRIVRDIKLGRLPKDSITQRSDTDVSVSFVQKQYDTASSAGSVKKVLEALEPSHPGYSLLKQGIPKFLADFDTTRFTVVPSRKDMESFRQALQKRLYEGGYLDSANIPADSAHLADAVKKFQKEKNITVDGKAGEGTIRMLNSSDKDKFVRIALSLDKYKHLPGKLPGKFIWVNAASNTLYVYENGDIKFSSKVITGKPLTRTPLLNSQISEIITYPQWLPPASIITKEILPAVKKNPGYLSKRGFSLVDSKGEEVDPFTVDWSKYSKSIPFRVVQGSGDANALGIIKFVFANKYAVYLHDTNQRYLFGNAYRSLSHGCVRVQEWRRLANYILRNDSLVSGGRNYTKIDSLNKWLTVKKKMSIPVRNKIPVYIRYITCDGGPGGINFYDDVYTEDKKLREKYFAGK